MCFCYFPIYTSVTFITITIITTKAKQQNLSQLLNIMMINDYV